MTKQLCPECQAIIWQNPEIPYLICPQCGCKLPEHSSEDADEGKLQTAKHTKKEVIDYDNLPF